MSAGRFFLSPPRIPRRIQPISYSRPGKGEPLVLHQSESETGMHMRDLLSDPDFIGRPGRKRDFQQPFEALSRITKVFAERPDDVLQELVEIAVTCCGADSAGISLEEPSETGEPTFRWVAISGTFSEYL